MRQTHNSVTISWSPPLDPNGDINVYTIDYNINHGPRPLPKCVTHNDFVNNSKEYTLENLEAGNYTIRVKAITDQDVYGSYSEPVTVHIEATSNSIPLTIVVIGVFVTIIV